MVTKFGGQILATKFGFVPDWLVIIMQFVNNDYHIYRKQMSYIRDN